MNDLPTNSVALVREQTIPTERPQLLGEVSANFCEKRQQRHTRGEKQKREGMERKHWKGKRRDAKLKIKKD
jgi:hypothetical protein